MSGQPPGGAGLPASRPTTNGNPNGGMPMAPQQRGSEISGGSSNSGQSGTMSQQNLNGIVWQILNLDCSALSVFPKALYPCILFPSSSA